MIITLPSGLTGEGRGLSGREAQQLADPALSRSAGSMDTMLRNCFTSITDPGPYPFEPGGKPDWLKVLLGDRFAALIDIRGGSLGYEYAFSVLCSHPLCGLQYEWEIDLRQLERRPLPPESADVLRRGENRFTTLAPDGRAVAFKLATGADEIAIGKRRRANRNVWGPVDALAVQILEVDELGEGERKVRAWLEDMPFPDLLALQDAMQAHDCGVETSIESECTYCGWRQEVAFPFQPSFFLPKRRKSAAPPASRASSAPIRSGTSGAG